MSFQTKNDIWRAYRRAYASTDDPTRDLQGWEDEAVWPNDREDDRIGYGDSREASDADQ